MRGDSLLQLTPYDHRAHYNRGLAREALGDDREAVVDYGEALRQAWPLDHATLAEIHDDRRLAQLQVQNYRGAIADFTQAIQLNPVDLRAYFNRGCTHHHEGNYAAALIDFDQVLQIAPDYAEAAVSRGLVRHQLGQKGEAIGAKLASMRALRMLLVSGVETLRLQCHDSTVNERFKRVQENEESVLASLDRAIAGLNN